MFFHLLVFFFLLMLESNNPKFLSKKGILSSAINLEIEKKYPRVSKKKIDFQKINFFLFCHLKQWDLDIPDHPS